MRLLREVLVVAALVASACDRSKEPAPPTPTPVATQKPADKPVGKLGFDAPAPERVVAIGDLHGDLDSAKKALKLAGAIDDKDAWIGGKLVVVQTGDEIDRADDDRKVLDLFEKLKTDAPKTGGQVIPLVGNHEIMNTQLDFRYVTDGAYGAFSEITAKDDSMAMAAANAPSNQRGRTFAFLPGGPYAKMLADRPAVARVGDTIFTHGGVLPKHVRAGLDEINDGTRKYLLGETKTPPKEITAEDGVLWTRMYSAAPSKEDCEKLDEALGLLHAKRLVMGHTVQKPAISPACNDKAWRIDVGMSKAYGGPIQVLEIKGPAVQVLR